MSPSPPRGTRRRLVAADEASLRLEALDRAIRTLPHAAFDDPGINLGDLVVTLAKKYEQYLLAAE